MDLFNIVLSSRVLQDNSGGADYDSAYQDGYTEGENVGYNKGYTDGEKAGYNTGFEDGKQSGGSVAPNPLEYTTELNRTFFGATFPDNYELTLILPMAIKLVNTFQNATGITKITLKGNTANNAIDFTYAFRSGSLKILDLSEYNAIIGIGTYTFNGATALKEIKGEFDFSQCTSTNLMFDKCSALEEVRIKADTLALSTSFADSKYLSVNSIQSIIDGLATVETSQTLTLNANQNILQAHIDSANTKGWTIVGGTVVQEAWSNEEPINS